MGGRATCQQKNSFSPIPVMWRKPASNLLLLTLLAFVLSIPGSTFIAAAYQFGPQGIQIYIEKPWKWEPGETGSGGTGQRL